MKTIKIYFSLLIVVLFSSLSLAQTGKIVGKVTDLESGDPLIGANIMIEGTSFGAATNADGEYIILSVPAGSYTLKARFIGYKEITQSEIKVNSALTTQVDFQLPTESYQLETVVIKADKPLINKNITNSTNIVRSEDIENLPIRGVNNIVATQAGVVTQGGNVHVRGSRSDGVAFYVDGVLVNNPVFGGSQTSSITNAVEEIQFQAGGYSAEFGGANGGIISTQTKSGTEQYKIGVEAISDQFTGPGEKFLGTYSYGYSELVLTASGPILPDYKKLKFFIAANNVFNRSGAAFFQGLDYKGLFDPGLAASAKAIADAGGFKWVDTFDVFYPAGYSPQAWQKTYNFQGNLSWDLNPLTVRLNSSYKNTNGRNGAGYTGLRTEARAGVNEGETFTSNLKFTHILGSSAFYDVTVNYFFDYYVDYDPIFKHDQTKYGDSVYNLQNGTYMRGDGITSGETFVNPVTGRVELKPSSLEVLGFTFTRTRVPYNLYRKQKSQTFGGKFNFLYQVSKHEIKTGGEFTTYTIRRYSNGNPVGLASLRRSVPDGNYNQIYRRIDNYGYDAIGNQSDDGLTAPKQPVFAAYYIQDKMEFEDLVVNAGLRLDYIDIDGEVFADPSSIKFTSDNLIDPAQLVEVDPLLQVSPRLGFSFPVTDRTVFHAQYGKFVQQSRLRDVYQGYNLIADNIKGGFAISQPVGFGLRPERTTQYEIGFKQQLGEVFAFDITGFYKDIKDQVQIRSISATSGAAHTGYYAWVNGDFATTKGVEFKFDLRRIERISATLDYTYSNAEGTGSNPSSGFRQIWQSPTTTPFFPQQIAPLDFNQSHRGYLNVDYRFGNDDGPDIFGSKALSNLGLNMLFSFNSGFNYTKFDENSYGNAQTPTEALNASTTPWNFQLDTKLDKSFSVGPLNANVYLWVINILNIKNVVGVFNQSGDPNDDGYLTSPQGLSTVEGIRNQYGNSTADLYKELYKALNYSTGNFGTPRQIRLGIRLNY